MPGHKGNKRVMQKSIIEKKDPEKRIIFLHLRTWKHGTNHATTTANFARKKPSGSTLRYNAPNIAIKIG
ncbi:17797_t:CDS:2 [Gigaspora rosea]|nr:17797_t:CDS:2 [Gigaspora rosea]